jgi:hypothetical protein
LASGSTPVPKVIDGHASARLRDEREARGDRLSGVYKVLADEGFAIAELIGKDDRFAVLAENVA